MKVTKNLIIACTGSVATIKLPVLIEKLQTLDSEFNFNVSINSSVYLNFIKILDIWIFL